MKFGYDLVAANGGRRFATTIEPAAARPRFAGVVSSAVMLHQRATNLPDIYAELIRAIGDGTGMAETSRPAISAAVSALVERGLATPTNIFNLAAGKRAGEGKMIHAMITDAGRTTITERAARRVGVPTRVPAPPTLSPASTIPAPSKKIAAPRASSKQSMLVDLLNRDDGADIAEMTGATGWLAHTVRAALTGLRQGGFILTLDRQPRATRYRILPSAPETASDEVSS